MTQFDLPLDAIDVCLITYNEELFIDHCLHALKPYFKRVYVLDMSSQDRTVEVVRDIYGERATILSQPRAELFRSGFAAARNRVAARATNEWILQIDADEILVPLQEDTISFECAVPAAKMVRRNLLAEAPAQWTSEALSACPTSSVELHVRLYKRSLALRWESFLHEELWIDDRQVHDLAGIANLTVNHISHFRPFADRQEKEDFYAWILLRVHENPQLQAHMRDFYIQEYIPANIERFSDMAKRFAAKHRL